MRRTRRGRMRKHRARSGRSPTFTWSVRSEPRPIWKWFLAERSSPRRATGCRSGFPRRGNPRHVRGWTLGRTRCTITRAGQSPHGAAAGDPAASVRGARRSAHHVRICARIESPAPELPGAAVAVNRWWGFTNASLPCWPPAGWDRNDLPSFLGHSPLAGANASVYRIEVEGVRLGSARLAALVGLAAAAWICFVCWAGCRWRSSPAVLAAIVTLVVVGVACLLGAPWWQRAGAIAGTVGLPAAAVLVVVRGHRAAATLAAGSRCDRDFL